MAANIFYNLMLLYIQARVDLAKLTDASNKSPNVSSSHQRRADAKSFSVRAVHIILTLKCKKLRSCFLSKQNHEVFEGVMMERIFPCLLEFNFSVFECERETHQTISLPSPPHST